jgi:PAS domain S-box-containing protein
MLLQRILTSWSIRKKLLLLILTVLLPAAVIIVLDSIKDRRQELENAKHRAILMVESLSALQGQIAAGTKQMLSTLAQLPQVQSLDVEACNKLFREVGDQNPAYISIGIVTLDGNIFANSAHFSPGKTNVSERKHVKDTIESLDFSAGEYIVSRLTGDPSIFYGYPVLDASQRLIAIVTAGFRLTEYDNFIKKANLPPDSTVVILDHQGLRLYRHPENDAAALGRRPAAGLEQMAGLDEGTYERKTDDGIYRLVAFKKLRLTESSSPYLLILAGVPKDKILWKANLAMTCNLLILGLAAAIAVSLAWFLGNVAFTSPINQLVDAAQRFGSGELGTRTGLPHTQDELGKLSQSFDSMAELLEQRNLESKKSEEELFSAFRKNDLILNTAGEGIVGLDDKGTVTFANPAAREMLGYEEEELIGKDLHTTIHHSFPDGTHYPVTECPMWLCLQNGTCSRIRDEILWKKDGTSFPSVYSSTSIMENGRVVGAVVTFRDISVRKRAEKALSESEEQFRATFELAAVGVANLALNGRWLRVNRKLCEILGYSREEMLQRKFQDVSHPDDLEANLTLGRQLIPGKIGSYSMEKRFVRKDGGFVWCNLTVALARDNDGRPKFFIAVIEDITERKLAEDALRQSEERFSRFFHSSTVGTSITRMSDGQFADVNDAYLCFFGYTREEVVGKDALTLGIWANLEERAKMTGILEKQGGVKDFETTFRRKSGEIRDVSISMEVIELTGQQYILGLTHDITERKRAKEEQEKLEAQLFQAQKMESVGRLAGGVAHDFNNMLGVIIGRAEMAIDEVERTDPLYEDLQEILKAGRRSADLTRQLLAFARKQTAIPTILDLSDTISGILKMLRRLIGEDIDLHWVPGPELWKVKIDPSQVDQILANLVVNARDAISGVGAITMRTENVVIDDSVRTDHLEFIPGDYVQLTVSDTGEGMSQEVRENIFEPFFTTKELGKGTGLGLSTVYGIVKQNDGFIYVASEPGKGTTFKIYLPRFEAEITQAASEEAADKRPRGTETILLVEDDEAILNLSKTILEKLGYAVLTAHSPIRALHLVEEHPGELHLLITDVVMPQMNGRALAEQLGAIRPNLKCLYMSGYTADVIAHQGILDAGVNFIQKPFGSDDFASKVRQVLDHLE